MGSLQKIKLIVPISLDPLSNEEDRESKIKPI